MKTTKSIQHTLLMFAAIFSFVFTIPVYSGEPSTPYRKAGLSTEWRPVFIQLAGQAERARISLAYDACEYMPCDMVSTAFANAVSSLEGSAQFLEKSLVYLAPASKTDTATDMETDRILSVLQVMGKQMESSIAYSAPELNTEAKDIAIPAI